MAWTNSALLSVAVLLLIATAGATPGVEKYQDRHSKTIQQQQSKSTSWVMGEGVCPKEVPVLEITRGSYQVQGNASDPTKSIVFDCCKGYKKIVEGVCEPVCEKPCRNGKCVLPNECRCFFGYIMNMDGECVTTCPFDCLNGRCDMYENCNCNPGFLPDRTKKFCVPYCEKDCGLYGNCTAPNTCGCKTGYGWNLKLQCEPQCHPPCGAGTCIAPGTCQCERGFRLIDRSCQANCTRGCENGRCVANEICNCDIGWTLNSFGNKCEPVCEKGCQNGICIGPNNCKCLEGFKKLSQTSNVCKPDCKRPCINGECVAPNVCNCKPGFTMDYSGHRCKRVQSEQMINYVPAPAPVPPVQQPHTGSVLPVPIPIPIPTLGSNPGVVHTPNQPLLIVPSQVPQPQCNPSCVNANCALSNQCICLPGYVKDLNFNYRCNPTTIHPIQPVPPIKPIFDPHLHVERFHCFPDCVNATCLGPNQCSCLFGYTKDQQYSYKCKPVCEDGCYNGACVGPNVCRCHSGYEKRGNVCAKKIVTTRKPEPQCTRRCINGQCVGLNKCKCNAGYITDPGNSYNCLPQCRGGCTNSTCVAPDNCQCFSGFQKRTKNVCAPIPTTRAPPRCEKQCINGHCVGQNKCRCNHGYAIQGGQYHICKPVCHGGCANGLCTAPNLCLCNLGFHNVNNVCRRK